MEFSTTQTILVNIVFPVVGIGLIVFALVLVKQKRLSGTPVEIGKDKDGSYLKANTATFLILLGVVIAAGPVVYFLNKGYEERLAKLKVEVKDLNTKLSTKDEVLKDFMAYDLRLNLIFPEDATANPFNADVVGYVRKQDEVAAKPYTWRKEPDKGVGGIIVHFDNLHIGDKMYVLVKDGDKEWRSDDMIMPAVHLKMNAIND